MTKKYIWPDYIMLGLKTVLWIVGIPVWVPLAIIGYLSEKIVDRLIQAGINAERRLEEDDY